MLLLFQHFLNALRLLWLIVLWLSLLPILILLIGIIGFAQLPNYQTEIENWLTQQLQLPVTIGTLSTYWDEGLPTLALQHLQIQTPRSPKSVLTFNYLEITVDSLASIRQKTLIARQILIRSPEIHLIEQTSGQWQLFPLPTPQPNSANPNQFTDWLFQQHTLILNIQHLHWQFQHYPALTLQAYQLNWSKQAYTHHLQTQFQIATSPLSNSLKIKAIEFIGELNLDRLNLQGQFLIDQIHWKLPTTAFTLPKLKLDTQLQISSLTDWQLHLQHIAIGDSTQTLTTLLPSLEIQSGPKGLTGHIPQGSLAKFSPFLAASFPEFLTDVQGTLQNLRGSYQPGHWQLQTDVLNLAYQSNSPDIPGFAGLSGHIKLDSRSGQLSFKNIPLQINLPAQPLQLAKLTGQIQWQSQPKHWQISLQNLQLDDPRLQAKIVGNLLISKNKAEIEPQLSISIQRGELAILHPYLTLSEIQDWGGILRQGQLKIIGKQWSAQGSLEQGHLQYAQGHVQHLQAHFQVSSEKGNIHIKQGVANLTLPQLKQTTLPLTDLQIQLNWQRQADHWQLTAQTLQLKVLKRQLSLTGHLQWPLNNSIDNAIPKITANLQLHAGELAPILAYLPDNSSNKLIAWFKQAFQGGWLSQLQLKVQGPLTQLWKEGQIQLTAKVENTDLHYAEGWPSIQQLTATVAMSEGGLLITAQRGTISGAKIERLTAHISDLKADLLWLEIEGMVRGTVTEGLNFVQHSPLQKSIHLSETIDHFTGDMSLELLLKLPLSKHGNSQFSGKLGLQHAVLQAKNWPIAITELSGEVSFDQYHIETNTLKGQALKQPVSLSLLAQLLEKRTTLTVNGKMDAHSLMTVANMLGPKASLPVDDFLFGQTDWQLQMVIYHQHSPAEFHHWEFSTDLLGMGINLPVPLGKVAEERLPLKLTLDAGLVEQFYLRAEYGSIFKGIFLFEKQKIKRGGILLGSQELATLPEGPEILNLKGRLAGFSVSEWSSVLQTPKLVTWLDSWQSFQSKKVVGQTGNDEVGSFLGTEEFVLIEIEVHRFELASQVFTGLQLQGKWMAQSWQLALTADHLEGQVLAHRSPSTDQWQLEVQLKRLALTMPAFNATLSKKSTVPALSFSPQQLPIFTLECQDLRLGAMRFGKVSLSNDRLENGSKIMLHSQTKGLEMSMQIDWVTGKNGQKMQVNLGFNSANLEEMFRHLGFEKSPIEGRLGQVIVALEWSPDTMDLRNLQGRISLLLLEGQMKVVEPGLGRVLGLFDIQALPRRLALDFKDVVGKGLGFSDVVGYFTIKEGRAEVDRFVLNSSLVYVEMVGSTDFMNQSYEQRVTVIPHLSNPLPLAGALLGGGGGAALALVMQQIMRANKEHLLRYEYEITGSWYDPQITVRRY